MSPPDFRVSATKQAGPFRIRRIDYRSGLCQPRHTHDEVSMTLVLDGDIRETTRTGEAMGSALSVVVKPAGVEHADQVGPRGARTLQIAFRPEVVQELGEGSDAVEAWTWLHGAPACAPLLGLARTLRFGDAGAEGLEDRIFDVVGALGEEEPPRAGPPGWLVRVKEALDDELETGITLRRLARQVGAHPVSVSRAFHRCYGVTITEYRRRERVRRAAARIAGSSLSLSRVGHGTGHADHPHLCREFRRLTGLTPSEFRRLTRPDERASGSR